MRKGCQRIGFRFRFRSNRDPVFGYLEDYGTHRPEVDEVCGYRDTGCPSTQLDPRVSLPPPYLLCYNFA